MIGTIPLSLLFAVFVAMPALATEPPDCRTAEAACTLRETAEQAGVFGG